jgi:predicted GIY-YIG superfamily endonuclease
MIFMNSTWFLYVLVLANRNAYIGITTNPFRRFTEHCNRRCSDVWDKWGEPKLLIVAAAYPNYRTARLAERTWHRHHGYVR